MTGYYVLDGKKPVQVCDLLEWAKRINWDERHVAWTDIGPDWHVSTVFLGIDHRHFGDGPPILFETIVFKDDEWGDQFRYSTWEEAEAGHARVVAEQRQRIT